MSLDARLTRVDATRVRIDNPYGIDATLFANEQVPVEPAAVSELIEMLDIHQTVERFAPRYEGQTLCFAAFGLGLRIQ